MRETRDAATKAAIVHKHAESKKRCEMIELELKRMELEIKQKEFQFRPRYELAQIEIADEVQRTKDNAELANLEAEMARQEFDELVKGEDGAQRDMVAKEAKEAIIQVQQQRQASDSPRRSLSQAPAFKPEPKVLRQNPRPQQSVPQLAQPIQPLADLPADSTNTSTLLNTLVSTMEKIGFSHDLPAIEIRKFDGSPQHFPVFCHLFEQMINSKPVDESVKMSRLLQLLEGPPLEAVRRYEAVTGGLTKALKLLEDRYGQPCQIVRACVDTLTKGPNIASNDNETLQKFADETQVMFDTLKSLDCLAEMNVDNLEKMISRLPKWMQSKFAEHLRKNEQGGRVMPTFKDVVDFLRERASVASHPFFSHSSMGGKAERVSNSEGKQRVRGQNILTMNANSKPPGNEVTTCPMCAKPHPLYRCQLFRSKTAEERGEFEKKSGICFNCINSTSHISRLCKSKFRCQVPECGKTHHTLLHRSTPSLIKAARTAEIGTSTQDLAPTSHVDQRL